MMIDKTNLIRLAEALGGLPVYGCLPGSPAARAGVRYGDVLLSVDGYETPSWDAYLAARERSGDVLHLRLFREGSELEIEVVLDRHARLDISSVAATLGLMTGLAAPGDEPN